MVILEPRNLLTYLRDSSNNTINETFYNAGLFVARYAHFHLIDGNGFFYKSDNRKQPDYFLSDCSRIRKEKLPVYDWK